jgi:hypothetical protein
MARTVSTPGDAILVGYAPLCDCDCSDGCDCYSDRVEYLQYLGTKRWPSMDDVDRWVGRENRVILENKFACLGISTYCGLASVWMCARSSLGQAWVEQQSKAFDKLVEDVFGTRLAKVATASNGEAFFERVNS